MRPELLGAVFEQIYGYRGYTAAKNSRLACGCFHDEFPSSDWAQPARLTIQNATP